MHPTAERLLTATENLLAERGESRTSLRDITEAAEANVAAVSYHFRSKDALVAEVFRRALEEVTELRRRHLRALPHDASLREVVRAWLAPALDPASQAPREAHLWSVIARGMREQAPGLLASVDATRPPVEEELLALLAAHLPHLDPTELHLRYAATLSAMSALPDATAQRQQGEPPLAELVLDWVVGGLSGPGRGRDPSGPAGPGR